MKSVKFVFVYILILMFTSCNGQVNRKVSIIDFVQIINDNKEEVIYYYQNNWEILRQLAIDKNYIDSYQLLETPYSEEAPFHLILITTYKDEDQYKLSEERFDQLIEQKGPLKLLNNKKPGEFRKVIFNKEQVKHLSE